MPRFLIPLACSIVREHRIIPLVGETKYSYTYAQPPRKDTPYNLAHGTLAAEAMTPTSARLTYTMLTVGFLSSPACVALLIDMTVAVLTSVLSTLPKGLSPLNWLDDFLYLPEVLYVLFFIWLICSGPGTFSVDYWLAGKLLR